MARRSAGCARDSSISVARWVCWRRRASRSTAASSKQSIIEIAILHEGRSIVGAAQLEESVARYLSQLDTADRQEPSDVLLLKTTRLKEKLDKLKEEMGKLAAYEKQMLSSSDGQISLTDPDSRSMATSGRGSGVVGYNVQVAVDTVNHLIVTHEVTNTGSDRSQLANVAREAKAVLQVDKLEAVADRGYFNGEEILACEQAGICVTLPKPMTSGAKSEVVDPRSLADVDHALVRASCGVAETGSILLTDQDLKVNALAYLAHHLIVLLDPG